jgi:hypothetical protein
MKKRLRKKIIKREICVVVYGISINGFWRKCLFDSPINKKFPINLEISNILPEEILCLLRRYNLNFTVCRAGQTSGISSEIFEFQSVEFPEIVAYSENNPDVIGKSPFWGNSNGEETRSN